MCGSDLVFGGLRSFRGGDVLHAAVFGVVDESSNAEAEQGYGMPNEEERKYPPGLTR